MAGTPTPSHADDLFCHAIYATWHVVNRAYKRHLSALGLTYPQYITLVLLWERDHRIVSEIASSLAMETSTLTPLLKRLETNGLVRRERSKQDERQVVVSLTPAGQALQSKAGAITACMIKDTGLDHQELEAMIATLRKLGAGLSDLGETADKTTA
ncbi:MAG: MarR family winged helix-turn-helix transcriptional regulator [Cohaesibacteraceae bacterium]